MKLSAIFAEGIAASDLLLAYYCSLCSPKAKKPKSTWVDKFYSSKVIYWPKKDNFWHASCRDANILLVGNAKSMIPDSSFHHDRIVVLLRSSLVMAMAAVDKILHEAISANFGKLLSSGDLDSLANIPLSDSYQIAIKSRESKGGVAVRPGHMFKEKVLVELYKRTFLSAQQVERVSSTCGKKSVFTEYSKSIKGAQTPQQLKDRWSELYERRNAIAHECDMVRKEKTKKIHFNSIQEKAILNDIAFIKSFGAFLAVELQEGT
jgi:hypothetical protein